MTQLSTLQWKTPFSGFNTLYVIVFTIVLLTFYSQVAVRPYKNENLTGLTPHLNMEYIKRIPFTISAMFDNDILSYIPTLAG